MEPYLDRYDAGRVLAGQLQSFQNRPDVLVLGLPRGGLPVAGEVARALGAPLDILVVRKVGVPSRPEVAMGALASIGGQVETVYNEDVMAQLGDRRQVEETFKQVAALELSELERREKTYRAGRPPVSVAGRTVILVDDGLATGATMRAAAAAVRSQGPARIIVAVPVGVGDACARMQKLADEVVCVWVPERLHSVGQAYERFSQSTDDEVRRILDAAQKGSEQ